MEDKSKNTRDFYRVATFATCLGFAVMGGLLGSLREVTQDFRVEFSGLSLFWAAVGAVAGWLLWKLFRSLAEREDQLGGRG